MSVQCKLRNSKGLQSISVVEYCRNDSKDGTWTVKKDGKWRKMKDQDIQKLKGSFEIYCNVCGDELWNEERRRAGEY